MLRGSTGERFRGDGRVCLRWHRARGLWRALLLAAGGRRFGSPRRHRCPTSASRWGNVRWQVPPQAVPCHHGPRPSVPSARGYRREPTRSHAVAPIRNSRRRGSRDEPDAGGCMRGVAISGRDSTAKKVLDSLSAGWRRKSSGGCAHPFRPRRAVAQRLALPAHVRSGTPARKLAQRAITNNRSATRFR